MNSSNDNFNFMQVLARPSMMSRASRPLSLTVPPEIFLFVTKARMTSASKPSVNGPIRQRVSTQSAPPGTRIRYQKPKYPRIALATARRRAGSM
jgi:hypothetical protein